MKALKGKRIYLSVLEREHCKILFDEDEYDFDLMAEPMVFGRSLERTNEWFDDMQKRQEKEELRLGVFLYSGDVIGDIALQDIDWKNRSCNLGLSFARKENRGKGYGKEAIGLLLEHAFCNLGLERIEADTLENNIPAQQSLEKAGFTLEGRERKAVYYAGKKHDRLHYAMLVEEYLKRRTSPGV